MMRSVFLGWRFYHQFRTDHESPLRRPQLAVCTPVLSHDGGDMAAALETILEIGERDALNAAIANAFAGAELDIDQSTGGLEVQLFSPEFRRPFQARELSDGTLKYLCLLAALLSPRPPSLLTFNEPDASLHPQLYEPLALAMAHAAAHSQLWITTHSPVFAALLQKHAHAQLVRLEKRAGATVVVDRPMIESDERWNNDLSIACITPQVSPLAPLQSADDARHRHGPVRMAGSSRQPRLSARESRGLG
jgi:predicted ATPase